MEIESKNLPLIFFFPTLQWHRKVLKKEKMIFLDREKCERREKLF
jgi:hypothetical protein